MKYIKFKSISLLLFAVIILQSCIVEYITSSYYHYENNSKKDIKIYAYENGVIKDSILIKQNETYSSSFGEEGVIFRPPLFFNDSVEVIYNNEKK